MQIWATVSLLLLLMPGRYQKVLALARAACVSGSAVLMLSVSMDRAYYGEWVFPPLRFLYYNLVQSLAVFYGANRWDYYVSEGLPLLLTTAIPFAYYGVWQTLRPCQFGPDGPQWTREERREWIIRNFCGICSHCSFELHPA